VEAETAFVQERKIPIAQMLLENFLLILGPESGKIILFMPDLM